ncbi:hypothetical protein HY604_04925 [Candidatus Peregrinibacteria bacterium]|nr:hypothetical protein [Candidatus Peregrinibacteria bacterium]
MPQDQTQTAQAQQGGSATSATGATGAATLVAGTPDIVVDKAKSPEKYIEEAEAKYIIPKIVREKFLDLVKLIYETESMNQEEREYWMQILPIMTEDQIVKFREILVNERDQLNKLDKDYEQEMAKINANKAPEIDEVKLREKMQAIKQAEKSSEAAEKSEEELLLKKLSEI